MGTINTADFLIISGAIRAVSLSAGNVGVWPSHELASKSKQDFSIQRGTTGLRGSASRMPYLGLHPLLLKNDFPKQSLTR